MIGVHAIVSMTWIGYQSSLLYDSFQVLSTFVGSVCALIIDAQFPDLSS